MRLPDFFIAGAPRCGTTALYHYLNEHPRVFLPELKEPHFFATDVRDRHVCDLERYRALFAGATGEHAAVGEASARYLFSDVALERIRERLPAARILVMLRNPIDLVHSWHSRLVYWRQEDEPSFARAWALQETRRAGRRIPPRCTEPRSLQYSAVAALGTQVERLFRVFPRSQVKVVLLDELRASARTVYESVLRFLELEPDGRQEFPRLNEDKRARLPFLQDVLRRPPSLLVDMAMGLKHAVGLERLGVRRALLELNERRGTRAPLSPELRAALGDHFRPEVERLARCLGVDLSRWNA